MGITIYSKLKIILTILSLVSQSAFEKISKKPAKRMSIFATPTLYCLAALVMLALVLILMPASWVFSRIRAYDAEADEAGPIYFCEEHRPDAGTDTAPSYPTN